MSDPYDTFREKTKNIWRRMSPDKFERINDLRAQREIIDRIAGALDVGDTQTRRDVGFHMTDWVYDAAFVLALHLHPEEFTDEEIEAGISCFLVHAPAHVIAAARQTENSTDDVFSDGCEKDEIQKS
jgi:hypothetical protein